MTEACLTFGNDVEIDITEHRMRRQAAATKAAILTMVLQHPDSVSIRQC